jgi:hypothetical protein
MDIHESVSVKIWWDDDMGLWAARARVDGGEVLTEHGGSFIEARNNIMEAIDEEWFFDSPPPRNEDEE